MVNTGIHSVWLSWLTCIGFKFLVIWLFPTVLAPLFNRFTPLDAPELQERIYALAKRCEFPLTGLYVMDGSKRSAHGNAYFTGVGRNKRIVFFDTLLSRLNTEDRKSVV